MKKEIFYLLIIPLFIVVSIAVASLFLSIQRPIYSARSALECYTYAGGPLHTAFSNVVHDVTNPAIVVQACNLMGKSVSSVTSRITRTSHFLLRRSRLIYLVVEAHDPQLAADYVNALTKALCAKYYHVATGRVRLVEPAYTPDIPCSPQWTITLLLAAAGGFVAGLSLYLFGYALRRKST
jgi:capsular polysaccharide biosynthesis protein